MLGIKTVIFKKHRDRWFSIPSLTLNSLYSSRQCAAVRTQAGWMRTPPHRNFPLVFCSIIWNKTREVWHCMEHSSQNTLLILLGCCQIPRLIKHQRMSHSLKPKLYKRTKALWIESLWNTYKKFWMFFLNEGWLHPISMGWCWSLQRSTLYSKLWKSTNEGCVPHQRQHTSQAAALTLWYKRPFNIKGNQALIICIH